MLGLLGHVKVGNSLEVGNKQQLPVSVHFRGMSATQYPGMSACQPRRIRGMSATLYRHGFVDRVFLVTSWLICALFESVENSWQSLAIRPHAQQAPYVKIL